MEKPFCWKTEGKRIEMEVAMGTAVAVGRGFLPWKWGKALPRLPSECIRAELYGKRELGGP